jgi:hypothetical protein
MSEYDGQRGKMDKGVLKTNYRQNTNKMINIKKKQSIRRTLYSSDSIGIVAADAGQKEIRTSKRFYQENGLSVLQFSGHLQTLI